MKTWLLAFLDNFWMLLNLTAVFILLGVIVIAVFKLLQPQKAVLDPTPIAIGKPLNIKVIAAEDKKSTFQLVMSYAFDNLYKNIARPFMLTIIIATLAITMLPDSSSRYLAQLNILGSNTGSIGFVVQISSVIVLYLSIKYIFNKKTKLVGGGCGGCR